MGETRGRSRYSTGTIWERNTGYSRAVRVGDSVIVSGTTAALPNGEIVGEGDAYAQTRHILDTIASALEHMGSSLHEVVRYRAYLVNIDDTPAVSRALSETFGDILPANTLLAVAALADPRMLIEIEADAIAGSAYAGETE